MTDDDEENETLTEEWRLRDRIMKEKIRQERLRKEKLRLERIR